MEGDYGLETWSWTLEDVGHKAGIPSPSPNPFKCLGSPGEERGDRPMDRDPFCEFGDKGWRNGITVNIAVTPPPNLALSVYSSQRTVHADLEQNYCFIGLIL
jgi:hypothetical protein